MKVYMIATILILSLYRIIDLVENEDLSVVIEPEGGTSSSECSTNSLETSELTFGDVSELNSITFGRYTYISTYI